MSSETSGNHLSSASNLLDAAETYFHEGNPDAALSAIEEAVYNLREAGVSILAEISGPDIDALESRPAAILRRFAEESGIMPENFVPALSLTPIPASLGGGFLKKTGSSLSASEIAGVLKTLYAAPEETADEPEKDIPVLRTLADLLIGQNTLSGVIFSENGAYDALSQIMAPYLIIGAAYLNGDEEIYEEKIPGMLDGPVKRLTRLLYSLLTSAFISGLFLLIIKRVLATRKVSPGVIGNTVFLASFLSLTVANIPMFIEGARAVVCEFRELRNIIENSN
ncbi:MAG TPA: hypothetical protein VJY43_04650 [Methanocorpusculum sp.]|nr:hypothetical protein [Methanocorpusculum sp.]